MAIPELENEPLGNCSRWKNLHKASRCSYNQKSLKDFCIPVSELPEHRWSAVHVPPTVRHGNEIIFPQNRNQKESSWNDRAKALHLSQYLCEFKRAGNNLKTIFNSETSEHITWNVQDCQGSRFIDPLPLESLSSEHLYLQPVPA